LRRCSPTKSCDGVQMAIFASFLHPVFPASHVQHMSDLHSKFELSSMVDIQSPTAENRRGKKKKKIVTTAAKDNVHICYAWRL